MKAVITWFEIPVEDMARAKKFYGEVFQIEMPQENMNGADMAFFSWDEDTVVSGALVKHEMAKPAMGGVTIYFTCGSDVNPFLDRVESAGGTIIVPKTLISEQHGYFALFGDTEGNCVGLYSK